MILLMLTAQEGRLPIDTAASLNTVSQAAQPPRRRIVCALVADSDVPDASAGVKTGGIAAVLNRR